MIFHGCWPVCGRVVFACAHAGFVPEGLYRIDCWCVAFGWCCTSMSIVRWEAEGLQAALTFLSLSGSSWWTCRECAGQMPRVHPGFLCVRWKCGTCFPSAHLLRWIMRGSRGGFLARLFWCRGGELIPCLSFASQGLYIEKTISQLHLCFAHSIKKKKKILGSLMSSSVRVIGLCVVCQAPHRWTCSALPSTTAAP